MNEDVLAQILTWRDKQPEESVEEEFEPSPPKRTQDIDDEIEREL